MEEAQRLCDRIAVIDEGRVVALDTPRGLIGKSATSTVITFTPARPIEQADLAALPGLTTIARHDDRITLRGTEETVTAVIALIARRRLIIHQFRIADATLDDAFLDLTTGQPR